MFLKWKLYELYWSINYIKYCESKPTVEIHLFWIFSLYLILNNYSFSLVFIDSFHFLNSFCIMVAQSEKQHFSSSYITCNSCEGMHICTRLKIVFFTLHYILVFFNPTNLILSNLFHNPNKAFVRTESSSAFSQGNSRSLFLLSQVNDYGLETKPFSLLFITYIRSIKNLENVHLF